VSGVVGYVALGSNLGDRRAHLRMGLQGMAARGIVPARCSSLWETEPVGSTEPRWFLNMVARVRTSLSPHGALGALLEVERRVGRTRSAAGRNAPRILDLDLLTLGDARIDDDRLTLPHPRMWERRFVLCPLAEIAPGLREPASGRTVREILEGLHDDHEVRRISADDPGVDIIPGAEQTGLERAGR
jgi:2-amino-4-hydroxy-6-hydroxymethyldihydropteridine diphosphokinase